MVLPCGLTDGSFCPHLTIGAEGRVGFRGFGGESVPTSLGVCHFGVPLLLVNHGLQILSDGPAFSGRAPAFALSGQSSVPGVGGLWIGDARRYPVFSARDRRRIAFGPESTHRPGGIDDAWHKSADEAGVVILDTEAVDRDGKRGWIVVPAAAAKAIRKATT